VSRTLVTVSGVIPDDVERQVEEGRRPRPDYLELAAALDADLLDVAEARRRTGRLGRAIERVAGTGPLLAWACHRARRDHDLVLSDGEQVGLPLAALSYLTRRRPRHAMIVHVLSPRKKVLVFRALRLGRRIDTFLTYASSQRRFIVDELGVPADQVVLIPFMVDSEFFSPERVTPRSRPRPMVCSAGLERRDFPTLMDAVDGLDLDVVIAAASPWSKQADSTEGAALPANVTVCKLGFVDLRQLYADATAVVMPLEDVDFQAGVTTILEAMAMEKAVVCSRTQGQTDVITDRVDGVYVPPGDASALRARLVWLLADDDEQARLGRRARALVTARMDVTTYARLIAGVVRSSGEGEPAAAAV
jgi:glycosyltransferase involved in cell wall biosynthesis